MTGVLGLLAHLVVSSIVNTWAALSGEWLGFMVARPSAGKRLARPATFAGAARKDVLLGSRKSARKLEACAHSEYQASPPAPLYAGTARRSRR